MMNLNITQDNLYLLLPSKISWLAMLMVEEKGVSLTEAIETLYKSDLYKQLEIEETKLWHFSPLTLFNMFDEEMKLGKIVFPEEA